jgi:hypothetical protein
MKFKFLDLIIYFSYNIKYLLQQINKQILYYIFLFYLN